LEAIKKKDRLLILAPHPDDEVIGCAGIIQQALGVGAEVKVVYLTNGDHNQLAFIVYEKRLTFRKGEFLHMGEVRRKEAVKAMELLGLKEKDLIFLGYPDFGTFAIFRDYWGEVSPYRSLLTGAAKVPYPENFSFQSPYRGESILIDLKRIITDYQPNKIFVSHPADTNSDHKALYLFLEIALADLKGTIPPPKVYAYLVHCLGWPLPRHYHPALTLRPPQKFQDASFEWRKFDLSQEELEQKRQAMLCYRSQTASSAFYLLAFVRQNELCGAYPDINLENGQEISYIHRLQRFFGIARSDYFTISKEGKATVTYQLKEGNLLIHIQDRVRGLNRRIGFRLYLFPYKDTVPFADMPKVCIFVRGKKFKVLEKKKVIKPPALSLDLGDEEVILKIPLQVLREPSFILASLVAYGETLPSAASAFRKINIIR